MNKNEARTYYKNIRKNIPEKVRDKQSKEICKKITDLILCENFDKILLYAPLKFEVDVMPVFECFAGKKEMYFPRVLGDTMNFYEVKDFNDLSVQSFNINEPKDYCKSVIFNEKEKYLLLVPGIAFDKKGGRIGYGKGYYDKFLSEHENIDFFTVGVCFDECFCDNIETEKHDKTVKRILTFSS